MYEQEIVINDVLTVPSRPKKSYNLIEIGHTLFNNSVSRKGWAGAQLDISRGGSKREICFAPPKHF